MIITLIRLFEHNKRVAFLLKFKKTTLLLCSFPNKWYRIKAIHLYKTTTKENIIMKTKKSLTKNLLLLLLCLSFLTPIAANNEQPTSLDDPITTYSDMPDMPIEP